MGISIYPTPQSTVTFNGQQPVYFIDPQNVNVLEKSSSFGSVKFSLTDNKTAQNFVLLSSPSNRLVIHSVTISNHLFGNTGDRLGVRVHASGTGGGITDSNVIACNYDHLGTKTFNYDSGLKLLAGVNLYYSFDYIGTSMSVNGLVTVVYREVSA